MEAPACAAALYRGGGTHGIHHRGHNPHDEEERDFHRPSGRDRVHAEAESRERPAHG